MPLAIPGVREYPRGINGSGDIDSGPLFFGISLSASTVTLGAALQRYVADPVLAQKHGAAGRDRVESLFSIDVMTAAYGSLYNSLAAKRAE